MEQRAVDGGSGSVAVVTGATRGLGRAIARRLALDGHRVVAVGRSTPESGLTARCPARWRRQRPSTPNYRNKGNIT